MSQLFHDERGRCHYLHYDAVSSRRRLRKQLRLPERIDGDGTLYLLGRPFPGSTRSLQLAINGRPFTLEAAPVPMIAWHALPVPHQVLQPGDNTIELWCDTVALDGWAVAIESGFPPADSRLSVDGGQSWRSEGMGITHDLCGEYVVRLRVHDPRLRDPAPPPFQWEDPQSPWLETVRAAIPAQIRDIADPWARARALSTWVCTQWSYRNTVGGVEYTPWDALTILAWGKADQGYALPHPITMCVHFGVTFTICALALGLPARCICCKRSGLYEEGHFISEVWIDAWNKWCQVDANTDIVFLRDGVPLSVAELADAGSEAGALADYGPGYAGQSDYIKQFTRDYLENGSVFAHWAVWPRNDFLSHPELTPPAHGSLAYCETDWAWAEPAHARDNLAMFPCVAPGALLMAAPPASWRAVTATR